jgi:hypothetical protein
MLRLQPMPMRRLFRAISANRHAAPAPRVTARMVGKEKRAGRPFAGFHMRKIFGADKARERLADRLQKRLR